MNRRGSYIVEAAIVLPIVILVTITIISVILFFYEQSVSCSRLHMVLRAEAASESGRTLYMGDVPYDEGFILEVSGLINKKIEGNCHVNMVHKLLIRDAAPYELSDSCYVVSGAGAKRSVGK